MPAELAEQLFDRLTAYYADDDNVTVIVDRRRGERRDRGSTGDGAYERTLRDRRRRGASEQLPLGPAAVPIDGSV
ncbi:hypothetical protein Q5424_09005 [Conexibacter sp. JD483]|uniref:hypothetical protein n=1 Tax=unclassified Conexibacter TaxID=2627773 RepID=UPI00271F52EA|nr:MULTISPECIES: hypothetical protein [unclassified Conexibacter]MDO8184505.1 hypothetical protein [Conexibacter sp. CPCC 205706]MDO8197811.1 hypothetical protein [Conexibacter sp. CPCC 205762]MDR9369217.1 hypothetical protein [Conexibacter sp. JD483]